MRPPLRRAIALSGLTAVVVISGSIAAADGTAVRDITDRALAEAPDPTDLDAPAPLDVDEHVEARLQAAEGLAPAGAPAIQPAPDPEPAEQADDQAVAPRPVAAPDRGDRTAAEPGWVWHASWYGPGFHGRTTANGETYDQYAMTAAHKSLPFGTTLRVTNVDNGRSVVVRINDRGPFIEGRDLDLSKAAADALGFAGVATVRVVQL